MKRLFAYYFEQLPVRSVPADDAVHLLNEQEIQALKRLEILCVAVAAIIGAAGVLLLYLPQYYFPEWFWVRAWEFAGLGRIEVPIVATVYGIGLVFVEIWLLYLVNLYAAHHMAVAMGLLTPQTKASHPLGPELLQIGLEQKNKSILRYGLDPYQGLSKRSVWFITLLFSLKATLSNMLVKFLLRRMLGRLALRQVMDLASIPVFAFWNAVATRVVLREARVVIMGQHLIEYMMARANGLVVSAQEQVLVYDTLQFIAVSKRDFHRNHHYLTERLMQQLGIAPEEYHPLPPDYFEKFATTSDKTANLCRLIILLGFVLDGELSWREQRRLHQLHQQGILAESLREVVLRKDDFYSGRGLDVWFDRYLPLASDSVQTKL